MKKTLVERFAIMLAATFVFVSPAMNSIAVAEGNATDSGQSTVTSQEPSAQPKASEDTGQTEDQPATQTPDSKGTNDSPGSSTQQQPATQAPPASNDSSTKDDGPKGNPEQPRAPTTGENNNQGNPQTTKSNLAITKYETGTNKPLAGATFNVKAQDGSFNANVTTQNPGFVNVNGLIVGKTYIITEIDAPPGYKLNSTPKTHTLYQSHNRIAFYNEKLAPVEEKTTLTITKLATGTNKKLAGAAFSVKAQDGSGTVKTGVTNASGVVTFSDLIVGKQYTVTETSAPEGYTLLDAQKTITAGTEKYVTFFNSPKAPPPTEKGSVTVYKKDKDTGELLAGATFALKEQGVVKQTLTTGPSGTATFGEFLQRSHRVTRVL